MLLKIEFGSDIDTHHRSFLDVLLDPLRSGQYHISEPSGRRRFLEQIVAAIIGHVSKLTKTPDSCVLDHYQPKQSTDHKPPDTEVNILHLNFQVSSQYVSTHATLNSLSKIGRKRCNPFDHPGRNVQVNQVFKLKLPLETRAMP